MPERLFGDGDLFRLSARHGPSFSDGLGLIAVFAGWLFYLYALWNRRRLIQPRWGAFALIALAIAAAAGSIGAFAADHDAWAMALAAMAVAAQIGLAMLARSA